jgi:hypothetical protein
MLKPYVPESLIFSNLPRTATLTVMVLMQFFYFIRTTECSSTGTAMNSLAFIGRLADELSSSSTFLSTIGCGYSAAQGE